MIRVIDLKLSKTGFVMSSCNKCLRIIWHDHSVSDVTIRRSKGKRYIVQGLWSAWQPKPKGTISEREKKK
jgi:hypothetical protein